MVLKAYIGLLSYLQKYASPANAYDAVGCGVLLYTCGKEKGDIAFASCTDHTSLLPAPSCTPAEKEGDNLFKVFRDGEAIFDSEDKRDIEDALCQASSMTSLRIGDFVALELAPMETLLSRPEKEAKLKAIYNCQELFDIKIVF